MRQKESKKIKVYGKSAGAIFRNSAMARMLEAEGQARAAENADQVPSGPGSPTYNPTGTPTLTPETILGLLRRFIIDQARISGTTSSLARTNLDAQVRICY